MPADAHQQSEDSGVIGSPKIFLVILSFGTLLFTAGRNLIPPLLPAIIDDLSITSVEAGLAISVMTIATALFQYPSGRLSDLYSRATILFWGTFVFLIGASILSVTPSYLGLLLGTAVLGSGNGLYTPAVRAKISDLFTERRGQALGINMTFIDVGGMLSAGLAVVFLRFGSWRVVFILVALTTAPLVVLFLRIDREAVVLTSLSLNLRSTGKRLVRTPYLRLSLFAYASFMFVYKGAIGFLPTFLQVERGFSPSLASLAFAILFGMGVIAKPIAGRLSDRVSRPLVAASALLISAVGIGLFVWSEWNPAVWAGVIVLATGQKAFFPPAEADLLDGFPTESAGGDLGAARTIYLLVGSAGPLYVGFVAAYLDYVAAFAGFVICLLLGVLALVRAAWSH